MGDLSLREVKFGSKRRTQPPNYSYAYIRQKRKARRLRGGENNPLNCCFDENQSREEKFTDISEPAVISPYHKVKMMNYPPPHIIIPPGTNVSVPPPPLPFMAPNVPLMRLPVRPPFTPLVPQAFHGQPLDGIMLENEKFLAGHPDIPHVEGMPRFKIRFPPPPMHFPIPIRPPNNTGFQDAPNDAYQREFSRIFAEHTIKVALGIQAGSQIQNRTY